MDDKDEDQDQGSTGELPEKMKPPPNKPIKKIKKRAAPEISDAIEQLDRIAQSASTEKAYDQFGKHVAYELRQLPPRQAILLQSELQSCITRMRLSCLEPAVHQPVHQLYHQQAYSQQLHMDIVSPSSSSSSMPSTSTQGLNEDYNEDILNHAIINSNIFSNNNL